MNELRIGTAMTDEKGHIVFLSAAAQLLFAQPKDDMVGVAWKDLFGLDPEDTVQLQALIQKPPEERAKIPVHLDRTDGRRVWLEVDVKDDPRDARGKIFFSMMSLKFMACAGCSTNGRSFTISWARARPCSWSTSRSATWRGLIRRC